MRSRTKVIVAGVGTLVLFSLLAATTLGSTTQFVTPTTLTEGDHDNARVNLEGRVTDLTNSGGQLRFAVTDGNASVPVVYDGSMPDTMADGRIVVAKGRYANGQLEADQLSVRAHEGERPPESR